MRIRPLSLLLLALAGIALLFPLAASPAAPVDDCSPDIYEPDNAPEQATWVRPNTGSTHHTFNPEDDRDVVRFPAVAGATYTLTTVNLFGGADTVLTLFDQDSTTIIAHNDDDLDAWPTLASKIVWTAPATGIYYASVHEFTGRTGCRGYDLKIVGGEQSYVPEVLQRVAVSMPTSTPTPCTPYLLDTVAVGSQPKGVGLTEGRAFVGLLSSGSLAVVNTESRSLLRTVSGQGEGANGVAVSGDYVYLAHRDSASVSIFWRNDPNTWVMTRTVGALPFGIGALPDRVFVANFGSNSVSLIDSATNNVVTTTSVGARPSLITTGDNRAWITALEGSTGIQEMDRNGTLLRTIPTGSKPFGIAYDTGGQRLFVSHWEGNSLWAIDAATGAKLNSVTLPGKPFGLAVNPSTGHLFVILAQGDQLLVLRSDTLVQMTTLNLPDQGGDDGGQGIALYGGRVYITNYGAGSLSIVQDAACE